MAKDKKNIELDNEQTILILNLLYRDWDKTIKELESLERIENTCNKMEILKKRLLLLKRTEIEFNN